MESLLFWSLYILTGPYKSRTKILNPTEEKPVCTQSRAHTWDTSITNEEERTKQRQGGLSAPGADSGRDGGITAHASGNGRVLRISLQLSSLPCRPSVHANVPLGGQMSHLTLPGFCQYFDVLIISCF